MNLKIRRAGDIAISYADTSKMHNNKLETIKSIEDMCKDGWNWQKKLVSDLKINIFHLVFFLNQ